MIDKHRDKKFIIEYDPIHLNHFVVTSYEWIDNLCFTINPSECLENAEEYLEIVKNKFLNEGWFGDGEIELIWIPPFMFEGTRTSNFIKGKIIWHVKQKEDGISWLLHEPNFFENIIKSE